MKPSELSFDTICDFLDAIANILKDPKVKKKYAERAKMIKGFMNHSIDRSSGEAFEVFRLIMPKLDTERGNYRLKEAALGAVFADAMNLKDTPKAKPLLEWTDPTVNATVAGNLSAIVEKVVAETARIPNDAPIELRKTMKVSDVNEKLDELVRTSGKRKDQANVLTYFVRNGTPRQCRYITQIILKNMKHGCGDKPFFDCWHPDAASYFDTHGMSIKSVFNNLKDDKPVIFSITPGKVVNPQLACTTFSAQSAIQKLQKYEKEKFGKDAPEGGDFKFLIETKFDGERIQVHRTGNEVQYFSRKAIDHGVRNKYTLLDEVILAATGGRISEEELMVEQGNNNNNGKKAASRLDCVLDGELIVWNKRKQNFEAFGTLKSVFHAAEEGKPPDTAIVIDDWGGIVDFSSSKYKSLLDDQLNGGDNVGGAGGSGGVTAPPSLSTQNGCTQNTRIKSHTAMLLAPMLSDCELMYIPFDILYCQHAEKINYPLSERHRLLKETVKASSIKVPGISGVVCRVEPLIPEETCFNEGVLASRLASTAEEIQEAIVTVRNRGEEGILIKALDSEWKPNNRSNHWLKIKPDYLYTQEIDAVVLGGWYSSSDKRTCDGITKYLMGLVKKPEHKGEDVTMFVTFCRVATGLTEEQRAYVNEKLKDLYVADPSAKPACVIASGPRSEQPDVWVKNPFDSLVFQLHADLRLISSVNYASQVSLRFPRIQFIREDRNARSANVDETLLETAMNKYREIVQVEAEETSPDGKKRKKGGGDGSRKKFKVIASNRAEKLAAVQAKTDVFKGRAIYIYPPPSKHFSFKGNLASWREVVRELGGKVALNNAGSQVTDVVAVTLNDPIVQSFMKKHPSKTILTPEWILHCKEEGMLCPLRPRDFLYMAPDDEKRPSREEADVFGDYYFQDSEVEDVLALFQHHIKAKDLDINEIIRSLLDVESSAAAVTFANGFASTIKLEEYTEIVNKRSSLRYSARNLLGWMDSELAAVGKLTSRTSILHGCTILLLEIPGNGTRTSTISGSGNFGGAGGGLVTLAQTKGVEVAALGATAAARRARLHRLKITAQMLGAKVVSEMTPEVTHLVGVINETSFTETTITSAAAAAAVVAGPESDALLAALKNSSEEGVNVLYESLVRAKSIQLVSADWIEEAAVLAVGGGDEMAEPAGAPVDPPNAAQFPLLDAEVMENVSSWRWTQYAPHHRPTSATGTGGRARQQGHAAAPTAAGHHPVSGEIIHVPSIRRGTAIRISRANHSRATSSQMTEAVHLHSGGGGVGVGDSHNGGGELSSIADFEMDDVPKAKSKPARAKKNTTSKTAAAKEREKTAASDAASELPPASMYDNDEPLSMLEYFDMMPLEESSRPLPSSGTAAGVAGPSTAAHAVVHVPAAAPASNADGFGAFYINTAPPVSTNPVAPAPSQQPPAGGGARRMSLAEKIRRMKEAKEKMKQTDGN